MAQEKNLSGHCTPILLFWSPTQAFLSAFTFPVLPLSLMLKKMPVCFSSIFCLAAGDSPSPLRRNLCLPGCLSFPGLRMLDQLLCIPGTDLGGSLSAGRAGPP